MNKRVSYAKRAPKSAPGHRKNELIPASYSRNSGHFRGQVIPADLIMAGTLCRGRTGEDIQAATLFHGRVIMPAEGLAGTRRHGPEATQVHVQEAMLGVLATQALITVVMVVRDRAAACITAEATLPVLAVAACITAEEACAQPEVAAGSTLTGDPR